MTEVPDRSRVLLISAGNPDATFLAAGLLLRDYPWINHLHLQGVDGLQPSPVAAITLTEIGHAFGDWQPEPLPTLSTPIDIGITLCIPT